MNSGKLLLSSGLFLALGFTLLLSGCGQEDDVILGPADEDCCNEVFAWLWAFDADDDSLRVYDTDTGDLHATFFAQPHALMREVMAGSETEPTVWMGSGGLGFAFGAGFGTHGDHAHMELPTSLGTVTTGAGNTHLSVDAHGETVSWANDGDQNFTLVDAETLVATTVGHGSPHSSSLVAHGTLMATHMNEKWARLIDTGSGDILATVTIDTLAHGDAFYEDQEQAFISCLNGISVVGFDEQANLGQIPYPEDGRVNFLFHGHDSARALAPVKLNDGNASEVWILDMQTRTLLDVHLAGSSLAWNRGGGNLALSADGSTAIMTDLASAQAYVVDLQSATAEVLTVEEADMACALGFAGQNLWLLDKDHGEVHFRQNIDGAWAEGSGFEVHPGSDWIFITSLDPAVEIIRDY